MRNLIRNFIFQSQINYVSSRFLKPFSILIPSKLKVPIHGFFKVRIDRNTFFYLEGFYTSALSRMVFWGGIKGFEYGSVRVFMEMIRNASIFLDIGANIGYYSILAAKCNPHIKILAFEPFPDAITAFERNINKNQIQDIDIVGYALSNKEGKTDFYYRVDNNFKQQKLELAGDNSLVNFKNDEREKITVESITLDKYLSKHPVETVDIIKIDTETTEYLILQGAIDTIKKFRPVIFCEVLKGFHESEIESYFNELDYLFYLVEPNSLKPCTSISQIDEEKNDFIFVPKEKSDLIKAFL